MQSLFMNQNEPFHINSCMYLVDSIKSSSSLSAKEGTYISPKDCQKRRDSYMMLSNIPRKISKTKKTKKIILGKPCNGRQKMSLQELKSLSRQIRPLSASDASFTSKFNSRALSARSSYSEQDDSKKNIMMLSRCLRENMHRAKARMMNSLKNSNAPQDIQIYKNLINKSANYHHGIATPDLGSSDDEDDCSSVSTLSSLQFRLVTSDSGKISAVLSEPSLSQSTSFLSQDENKSCPFVPLYTPTCLSPSLADIDLFLQHSWPVIEKGSHTNRDVTEDQINSWLQRGGYNDSMSPITMATDQELADLLDFDL